MPSLTELLEAFAGWDGSAKGALELRIQLASAGSLRPSKAPKVGERGLAKFAALYASPDPRVERTGAWLLANPLEARVLSPVIGDPALGTWPFHKPFEVSEEVARTWLEVLGQVDAIIDDRTRLFLKVMLQVRRRETWTVAAGVLGKLAHRDTQLTEHLQVLWRTCWPDGLGRKWPQSGLSGAIEGRDRTFAHLPRHTFVCACAYVAQRPSGSTEGMGTTLTGFEIGDLLHTQLPQHDADKSVVLRGYKLLLEGPDRPAVVTALQKGAALLGADVMSEEALRDLADSLDPAVPLEAEAYQAIRQRLIQPRWRPAQHDALWCWLETARWFKEAGDAQAVAAIEANAESARQCLELGLEAEGDSLPESGVSGSSDRDVPRFGIDRLVTTMSRLLDADSLHITRPRDRAILLCECRTLLARPEFAHLDWPTLVRLAYRSRLGAAETGSTESAVPRGQHPPMSGTVGEVGLASLGVMMSHMKMTSRTLMRGRVLSRQAVLAIASIDDGFVATQVAVQAERLLREVALGEQGAHSRDEQVRFLWQLLEHNPPARTFEELDLVLRGAFVLAEAPEAAPSAERVAKSANETGDPGMDALRSVIQAVSALDRLRNNATLRQTIDHFATLIEHTDALLSQSGGRERADGARPDMAVLATDLQQMLAYEDSNAPLSAPWWHDFDNVIVGEGGHGGLLDWALWLENAPPQVREQRRLSVDKVLRQLQAAVRMVRAARPSVTVLQFDELQSATDALRPVLGTLGWPEHTILRGLLCQLRGAAKEALDEGLKSRAVVETTRRALALEDEEALEAMATDTVSLDLLPVAIIKDVHGFLLRHMLFSSARRLRTNCVDRVPLSSPTGWMMPLYGAVAGGTFLVLDVGDAWLGLVKEGAWTRFGATVALTLLASFLLMASSSGTVSAKGSRLAQVARHTIRVLPTYLIAVLVALCVASIAMATLGRFDEPNSHLLLIIWSALSLFLGVFVGLIVQGQGITKRSDSG